MSSQSEPTAVTTPAARTSTTALTGAASLTGTASPTGSSRPGPELRRVADREHRRSAPERRRLRHEARDELAAAGVTLAGSILTTVVIWALVRWLG